MNQSRTIVRRDDMNSRRQSRLEFLNLLLHKFCHGKRILSMPHQHGTTGDFVAVFFVHAAAKLCTKLHTGHRSDIDRRPPHFADDCILDVFLAANPTDAPDNVLGIVLLNDAAAGRKVALSDCCIQFAQSQSVGPQVFRSDIDLIFHW